MKSDCKLGETRLARAKSASNVALANSLATSLEQVCTTMSPVKIQVIMNTSSGPDGKLGIEHSLAGAFTAVGFDARIAVAHTGAEVLKIAQGAARSDAQIIVAGGGD